MKFGRLSCFFTLISLILLAPLGALHAQTPSPVITSFTVSGDAVGSSPQTATGTITIAPPDPGCNVEVGAGGNNSAGAAEIVFGSTTVSFPIYATQEVTTSTTFAITAYASFDQHCVGYLYYYPPAYASASLTVDPPTYQFNLSPNPVSTVGNSFGSFSTLTVTRSLPVFTGPIIVQTQTESYYLIGGWNGPVLEYGGASCANQAGGITVGIPPNGNVAQFTVPVSPSPHTQIISLPVCEETVPQPTQIGAPTLTVLGYLDIPPNPADLGPCINDSPEACAGSPINLMTGNVWIQENDYSLSGLGGGLHLMRTWNSQWQDITPVSSAGMFGNGWRSTYEEQLTFPSAGTITYWRNDGNVWTFALGSNGTTYSVTSPPNQYASLTVNSPSQYTIVFADGTQKLFSQSGQLTAIVDRNGNQANFTYSILGNLTQVTDPVGRTLTFNYADPINPGQATSIQDQVGTIATYTYDSSSRLMQVVYADGSSLNFACDPSSSMITSVTDAQGKVLESHTYDTQFHRGLTSSRANGVDSVSVDYANLLIYDSFGDSTSIADEVIGGRHFIDRFNGTGCSSCGSRYFDRFSYDSQGNRLSATDASGRTTSYTYDGSGNVLTKTDATGAVRTYTYNQFVEVLTAMDPAGNVTTNIYDANGNLLSTTTPPPGGSASGSATSFAYDPKGELVQITDPRGAVTTLAYTLAGLLASVTDAQGKATTFQTMGEGIAFR
jgi:YD repeat-containing protein